MKRRQRLTEVVSQIRPPYVGQLQQSATLEGASHYMYLTSPWQVTPENLRSLFSLLRSPTFQIV